MKCLANVSSKIRLIWFESPGLSQDSSHLHLFANGFQNERPLGWRLLLVGARTLLGAPGLTTRSKKLGAPGIATRSKDATRLEAIALPLEGEVEAFTP